MNPSNEEGFLRALHAAPEDLDLRRVYSDWLEDHDDPRAAYLRLAIEFGTLPMDHPEAPGLRRRMNALRPQMPADWLGLLGDYRCTSDGSDSQTNRVAAVAEALGRPASFVDEAGYTHAITAGTVHPLTGALAYVECRSRQVRPDYLDILFHLRLHDKGREAAVEPVTYNPYFGCDVAFLEWYGDTVVMIYEEKHRIYACRFGLDFPARFQMIEYPWLLDGPHLGYKRYRETQVYRWSLPGLAALPPLSEAEAADWDLVPRLPDRTTSG